jgi:hypothetical protein
MEIENAFRSARPIYRAIEENDEDIAFLYNKIDNHPVVAHKPPVPSSLRGRKIHKIT